MVFVSSLRSENILTLCIGSTTSPTHSSRFPEMALFSSGPASCSVLNPACNVIWLFWRDAAAACSLRFLNLFVLSRWKDEICACFIDVSSSLVCFSLMLCVFLGILKNYAFVTYFFLGFLHKEMKLISMLHYYVSIFYTRSIHTQQNTHNLYAYDCNY